MICPTPRGFFLGTYVLHEKFIVKSVSLICVPVRCEQQYTGSEDTVYADIFQKVVPNMLSEPESAKSSSTSKKI